jgi:gliding motility-associated-like protein
MLNAVPSIGTGNWIMTTGPGTETFSPDANTPAGLVTVSEYGTYIFTWTETSNNCSASSDITVNFYQQPVANPGTGGNNCGLESFLRATPSVGVGTWTLTSGPGTATFTPDANSANTMVEVSEYGTYGFTWTEVNGTCSSSAEVIVNFLEVPAADAGSDGAECDLDFVFNARQGLGVGTWSKVSGPGNTVFSPNANLAGARVNVDRYGTYQFAWREVNSTCQSTDVVNVIFRELPSIFAGKDSVICEQGSAYFNAIGLGTFHWEPAAAMSDPEVANPSAKPDTTTNFMVTLTDQFGCKNTDEVKIEVWKRPVANAGPDRVLEYLFETPMAAAVPRPNETGQWSVVSGSGNFVDPAGPTTDVRNLSLENNIFSWIVSNRVCPPAVDYVTITVNDLIIPTLITPNMDGMNDYFVLRGIESLGTTELVIFDRRGAHVYKNENYANEWDGTDYNSKPLPDDTYFFVIKTESGKSISGYIVIRR